MTSQSWTTRFSARDEPQVTAAYLSPQADRVIWKVRTVHRSALEHWLHRFIPSLRVHDREMVSLWRSTSDGRDLRLLGVMDVKFDAPYGQEPEEIRWLPGGKRISFTLRGSLYTVPAD